MQFLLPAHQRLTPVKFGALWRKKSSIFETKISCLYDLYLHVRKSLWVYLKITYKGPKQIVWFGSKTNTHTAKHTHTQMIDQYLFGTRYLHLVTLNQVSRYFVTEGPYRCASTMDIGSLVFRTFTQPDTVRDDRYQTHSQVPYTHYIFSLTFKFCGILQPTSKFIWIFTFIELLISFCLLFWLEIF
jgi:hypothetical protein